MKLSMLGLAAIMTCSFSALAKVSIEEKENRVKFIERLGSAAPSISVDAYKRELEYERRELPLEVRARNEARLLAEKIQSQIVFAYEKAMEEHGDSEKAKAEVSQAIVRDLELAAPEFKEELLNLALKSLDAAERGGLNNVGPLSALERTILPSVNARAKYLNQEVMDASYPQGEFVPSAAGAKDSEKAEYDSYASLLESLTSDRENTRWVSTSNKTISLGKNLVTEVSLSQQVKIEFLGVSVGAGPTINFRREYITSANIMAEELTPIVLPDGNFDFYKRDRQGKIILKAGKPQKRFLVFYCNADLKFATEYEGKGSFKIAGVGASASATDTYNNVVNYNSRRILVPEYVGGQTVTTARINRLCNQEFLKTKLNDAGLTVEKSLTIEMQNLISSLRFSHPKTKCAVDSHCVSWFNNSVASIWKYGTYPRCLEESREKFRTCELRGLEGMSCRVVKNGKLISSGSWEVDCDKNLKCVQTEAEGWMKYAKGKCRPINPWTYRDPKKYPEYPTVNDLIEVEVL